VRGIHSQRGTSSLTGIYLDEMPISGVQDNQVPHYADLRTIDLERVEVLKGPQGTLFGEGAAGGVVRFITKDPDLSRFGGEFSTDLSNTADGGTSEKVTGVANLPLAQDLFGIRIAGTFEDNSGWIDQPTIGREDINDSEVKHIRAKALLTPLPGLKVKALVEVHRDKGGGSNMVNQTPVKDGNFRQAIDLFYPPDYTNDYDLYNLTASYDLGFAELLSSTSYASFDSFLPYTQLIDAQPVPWLEILVPAQRDSTIFSQEVRLTSATSGPFNWTAGAAYKDSKIDALNQYIDYSFFGGAITGDHAFLGDKSFHSSESWATFADGSYEFLDKFEIGGGLRYFRDKRYTADRPGYGAPLVDADTRTFDKLTYRVFGKYSPSENFNLYASLATGFRSGGINAPSDVARGADPTVGEENTTSFEVGMKAALLEGRVRLDTALFDMKYEDMQELFVTLSPVDNAVLVYAINANDAEVKGVEWDLGWVATDRLTLSLAGTVIDSEVTKIKAGARSTYKVGDPLNFVPDYSLSATGDYRFNWSESVPGSLQVNFDRQGKSYNSRRNYAQLLVQQYSVPEKDFLNVSVGAEWSGWQFTLYGRNLLDDRDLLTATDTHTSSQARPRTLGVSFSKAF